MHDIDTIRRLNEEAFNAAIPRNRANGRYVVTEYAGLHLIGFETFEDPLAANAHFVAKLADRTPDARFELLAPLPPHHGNERDQSEDYLRVNRTVEELAALGASSPTRNA